jgi:hypothetical protein
MSKKEDQIPPDRAAEHPDQAIIDYLEHCLTMARQGRVVFVVASVGMALPSNQPQAGDQRNPDRFSVAVGGFLGQTSFLLHPESRTSALDDVCRGAAHAAARLRETATPISPEKVS